jgi:hypothetical protein
MQPRDKWGAYDRDAVILPLDMEAELRAHATPA